VEVSTILYRIVPMRCRIYKKEYENSYAMRFVLLAVFMTVENCQSDNSLIYSFSCITQYKIHPVHQSIRCSDSVTRDL
jgi:hypothetical protein